MSELTIYDKIQDPMVAIEKFGEMIEKSNMFGCQKGQGSMVALMCFAEKTTPLKIFQKYYIVQNKFTMRSDRMLAELIESGGKYKWINTGDDGKKATLFIELNGVSGETTFTIEDAKRACLIKDGGNWTKYPSAMLRARVISSGMRMYAPTIVAGIYTPEEIQDIETEISPQNKIELLSKKPKNNIVKELENVEVVDETKNKNMDVIKQNDNNTKENNECIDKQPTNEVTIKNISDPVKTTKEKFEPKTEKEIVTEPTKQDEKIDRKQLIKYVEEKYGDKIKYLVSMLVNRGIIESGKGIEYLNDNKLKTLIDCHSAYVKAVDKLIEKENTNGSPQTI